MAIEVGQGCVYFSKDATWKSLGNELSTHEKNKGGCGLGQSGSAAEKIAVRLMIDNSVLVISKQDFNNANTGIDADNILKDLIDNGYAQKTGEGEIRILPKFKEVLEGRFTSKYNSGQFKAISGVIVNIAKKLLTVEKSPANAVTWRWAERWWPFHDLRELVVFSPDTCFAEGTGETSAAGGKGEESPVAKLGDIKQGEKKDYSFKDMNLNSPKIEVSQKGLTVSYKNEGKNLLLTVTADKEAKTGKYVITITDDGKIYKAEINVVKKTNGGGGGGGGVKKGVCDKQMKPFVDADKRTQANLDNCNKECGKADQGAPRNECIESYVQGISE